MLRISLLNEKEYGMKKSVKNVSILGLCTALALILAYVEILLPPLLASVPGVKIGLPNIVIILVLYKFGVKSAAAVSFIRIALVSMLFGNAMALIYSLAGATLSLLVMALLKKTNLFSYVGVSISGGVFHNVGQILTAMLLLETVGIGYYLIVLTVTGTISGILVGLCGAIAIKNNFLKRY